MLGFLAKAAFGGAVAYGTMKVLERYDVPAKLTALGTEVLDKMLIWFPDEITITKPTSPTVPPQAPPAPPVYAPPVWTERGAS